MSIEGKGGNMTKVASVSPAVPSFDAKSSFASIQAFPSSAFGPYQQAPISSDRHIPDVFPFRNTAVIYKRPEISIIDSHTKSASVTPEVKKPNKYPDLAPLVTEQAKLDKSEQGLLERKVLFQVASLQVVRSEVAQAEKTIQSFLDLIDEPINPEVTETLTKKQAQIQVIDALESNLAKIAKTYISESKQGETSKRLVALSLPKTGKIDILTSDEYKKVVRDLAKMKAISDVRIRLLAFGKLVSTEEIEKIVAEKEPLTKQEEKELEEKDIYTLLLTEDSQEEEFVPYVFKRDDRADNNRLKAFGQAANTAFAMNEENDVSGEDITNIVHPTPALISELALMLGRKDGSLEEIDRDLKKVRGFKTLRAAKRAIVRLVIQKPAVKIEEGKSPNVTNTDVKRVLKEFVFGHTQFI